MQVKSMKQAIVSGTKISVRAKRSADSVRLGTLDPGDIVAVLDDALDQDYAMVIWKVGYAYSNTGKYIRISDSEAEPPEANAVVTGKNISVRSGRGVSYSRLGYFHKDDQIVVLDPALDQAYALVIWQVGYAYCAHGKYIQFLPSTDEPNAVVTASAVSVREARSVDSAKLGSLKNGAKIVVLDPVLDQEYALISWENGTAYAYSARGKYIHFLTDTGTDTEPEPSEPNAIVTGSVISVREARSASSAKLGELKDGAKITVLDTALNQDYAQIVWNGGTGYAYSAQGKYIRFFADAATIAARIQSVLAIAKSCVGGKYIFGAQGNRITEKYVRAKQAAKPAYYTNGRFEFLLALGQKCDAANSWSFPEDFAWDCSGLWWYSANKAGVYGKSLDSTAHTFYHNYCTPITKAELQPGDAVFHENSSDRVTHMAIVGEGGVVYEAMSSYVGVVQDDSVDDRTAPKLVGTGTRTGSTWNLFGRPKIFME